MRRNSFVITTITIVALFASAFATSAETRVPLDDPSSPAVRALDLGDPFFRLVVARTPQPLAIDDIEAAIQPDVNARHIFVVHESIKNPAQGAGVFRRAVLSFSGAAPTPNGSLIDVASTVMLSMFFTPIRFPANSDFEAWGWDAPKGRYNYYKLINTTWEFRGSSNGPDVAQRAGCMQCHHNGTPIMKELMVPWPNWHSISDRIDYLENKIWPVTQQPRFDNLDRAENLEGEILKALRRFHNRAIRLSSEPVGGGRTMVHGARTLIRPLFETTEINLASSERSTGNLHPHSASGSGPIGRIRIPATFFVNARVIGNNGRPPLATLGIVEATRFPLVAAVEDADYAALVRSTNLRLFKTGGACNQSSGPLGDAIFAWLHPETGLFDVTRIESILKGGLVSKDFVAAVMAVDLRRPIFSQDRASLLTFVPDSYVAEADGTSNLQALVLAAIDQAGVQPDSAAALFAARLRSGQALELLRQDVAAFVDELRLEFADPGSPRYLAALEKAFAQLIQQRELFRQDPDLCAIVEGPLIPLP